MYEQRLYERVSFHRQVKVTFAGRPPVDAWTTDISLGGLGLISPMPVPAGTALKIAFSLMDSAGGTIIEEVPGQVMRSRSNIDGHLLGVAFAQPLGRSFSPKLAARVDKLASV